MTRKFDKMDETLGLILRSEYIEAHFPYPHNGILELEEDLEQEELAREDIEFINEE